jgi:hypothetical protein
MTLPICIHCQLPTLEVEGQFEKLDSFYLGEDAPPRESAGYWHTSCLRSSNYGPAWHDARLRNHVEVRSYQLLATSEEWSVVRHPRSNATLAFSRTGEMLSLGFPAGRLRTTEGGSIYRVEESEYHLELEETEVIRSIQDALSSVKTFPVLALFEALGINDRLSHPEALEGSLIHFSRALRGDWSQTGVSARWEYGVFVPAELEPYVGRAV